jgi:ribosome recycling factor
MSDVILSDLKARLNTALENVRKDIATVRTGRAKPSLVEDVKVEAYGAFMSIKELATISTPDTTLILISPWDKSLTGAIATGIRKAELNINPVVDGETVKVVIPALTQERREELVKIVHQKIETGKVMVRQIRTEIKEEIEAQEGESGVSEDDVKSWLQNMQKSVDECMAKLEDVGKDKEKELMTI